MGWCMVWENQRGRGAHGRGVELSWAVRLSDGARGRVRGMVDGERARLSWWTWGAGTGEGRERGEHGDVCGMVSQGSGERTKETLKAAPIVEGEGMVSPSV